MIVSDVLNKIQLIKSVISLLDDISDEHNICGAERVHIEDAQELLGEYIEELGKKKVQ